MEPPQYAVVAYVKNELGRFVEDLRRQVDPRYGHLPAHITVLPPRSLQGSESQAQDTLGELCRDQHPFEIAFGDVESFVPRTPVVFIRVAHAAYKMRELHDRLNSGPLLFDEPWPYMPHLTIFRMDSVEQAMPALEEARRRWESFSESRRVLIDRVTFVREAGCNSWVDLAPIFLGRRLAPTC